MTDILTTPAWNGTCHPAADLFPMLEDTELASLVAAIKEHGLNNPGWLLPDGTLLDGRNRRLACEQAGVEMRWRVYEGDDEIGFAISENVERRHLTTGQKAMAALAAGALYAAQAKARQSVALARGNVTKHSSIEADRPQSRNDTPTPPAPKKQRAPQARDEAAKAFKTSGKSVARAKRVMEKAPELAAKVAAGTLALDAAEKEVKAAERAATASERSASTPPPMDTLTKHKVIYADPPWRYEFSKTDNRAIENHYPTMTLEDICALQVPAADDAVLYMWATSPKLGEAMKVIESWGFRYATSMVWVKPSMGMGFYARIRHEMLLIATRGNPGTPEPSVRPNSVIEAPRGAHSAKPLLHDQLDAWWPSVTKVELFARQPVDSPWWSTWGNDLAVAA
jgi:N6-adenosine-specific RNA methylase IME4